MAIRLRALVFGSALCALAGFGVVSVFAGDFPTERSSFIGSVPEEILNFSAGEWEIRRNASGEQAYWADDVAGNRYLFSVQQELLHNGTSRWLLALTLFGSKKPELFIWLDNRYLYDMRKGIVLENGAIVQGAEMKIEAIPGDAASASYGTVQVSVFADDDRLIARRDFRALLIPVPGRNCTARSKEKILWRVNGNEVGAIEYWDCLAFVVAEDPITQENEAIENKARETTQIVGFHAEGEIVFQTWNAGGKTFAALTLDNRHRVATEVYDNGVSMFHFDEYENLSAVTLRLLVNGVWHKRVIKFRAQ